MEKPYVYPTKFNEFLSFLKGIPVILKERYSLSRRFKSIAKNPSLTRVFEAKSAILSNCSNNAEQLRFYLVRVCAVIAPEGTVSSCRRE